MLFFYLTRLPGGAVGNATSWVCTIRLVCYTVKEATFGPVWPWIVPDWDLGCGNLMDLSRLWKNVSFRIRMKHKDRTLVLNCTYPNNSL